MTETIHQTDSYQERYEKALSQFTPKNYRFFRNACTYPGELTGEAFYIQPTREALEEAFRKKYTEENLVFDWDHLLQDQGIGKPIGIVNGKIRAKNAGFEDGREFVTIYKKIKPLVSP